MSAYRHLLELCELQTHFYTFEGIAKAVDGVSFYLDHGEILGIVGESGCGKSVTAQTIMKLIPQPPGRIVGGQVLFHDENLIDYSPAQMRTIRGNRIAMIFQEPMTSLNPVYTIGDQIAEMFTLHQKLSKRESLNQAVEMLRKVQIPAPEKRISQYPHQLSGGMRQRAMIVMALSCNPEILIADEPTTALDVTVQAQILELMLQLQADYGTAIMMITHDLGVIAELAGRVVVMYAGRVVEEADTRAIFQQTKHPYTEGLLKSIPQPGDRSEKGRERLDEIKGTVPNLYNLPDGCSFAPRCAYVMDICRQHMPQLQALTERHTVRCWKYSNF